MLGLNVNELLDNRAPEGIVKGFKRKFLEDHAWRCFKEERWKLCNVVLTLLVHGIVIFPNIDNFVDQMAVEFFLAGNPVPFLLAYFYHTFHTKHEKKGGTLLCCAPLLHV